MELEWTQMKMNTWWAHKLGLTALQLFNDIQD
jgi:hypothetical protein